ncbi:hypothetical protein DQ237_06060 [Blastococcus sp. TF02-8]|uniref:hypothetical protein n=1 Tax=Blastococcus sp. TF02-8 TaxID=2250574 RepID=UPI000DE91807|nr:hypothetical protein [Blastococcus sp. TF02-8]RBY97140.1 hypothetical protein DQ237_06060 [Blastococcus sp. TF02-8]
MFVVVVAVPALLVVVLGYVVGHAVATQVCAALGVETQRPPEVAGWVTGLVLLAVVVRALVHRRRSRRAGHQK